MKIAVATITIQMSANHFGDDPYEEYTKLENELMDKVEWLKDKGYSISFGIEDVEVPPSE